MSAISLHIADIEGMKRLARALSPLMCGGQIWFLRGDLGMGKTSFASAVISALSVEPVSVTSPTFALMQPYDVICKDIHTRCWHIDLYRIESSADIDALGIEELAEQSLLLIEWPERFGPDWPRDYIAVDLKLAPEGEGRMVTLSCTGSMTALYAQFMDAVRYAL